MTEPAVTLGGGEAGETPRCSHDLQVAGVGLRLLVTRLLAVVVATLVLVSGSRWAVTGPHLVGQSLFALGSVLATCGFLGRLWALCYISGRKKRQLVTAGPYSMCRHPLYLFSLVGGIGLALATQRLTVALLYVAVVVWLPVVLRDEETFLAEHFADYAAYRRSVPALLPRRVPRLQTGSFELDTRDLHRGLLEIAGFLAVIPVLAIIPALQASGRLPFLFLLP